MLVILIPCKIPPLTPQGQKKIDAPLQGPIDIADLSITSKVTLNRNKIRVDAMTHRAKLGGALPPPEHLSCLVIVIVVVSSMLCVIMTHCVCPFGFQSF